MTEISDILHSASPEEIEAEWKKIMARSSWLQNRKVSIRLHAAIGRMLTLGSYHEVGEILSWHEALFSSVRKNRCSQIIHHG